MAGKGGKGLLAGKTTAAAAKDKDKKRPTSRSSRAGLQVFSQNPSYFIACLLYMLKVCIYKFEFLDEIVV